jgi:hypothetical protein
MANTAENQSFRLVEVLLKYGIVIKKISEALSILIDKRVTLEEKMIKSYFLKLASALGRISEQLLTVLAAQEASIESETLTKLVRIADEVNDKLEAFLKAARYDLNYLEQYFEHQFASELERSHLLEDSLKVFASLTEVANSANHKSTSQAETE